MGTGLHLRDYDGLLVWVGSKVFWILSRKVSRQAVCVTGVCCILCSCLSLTLRSRSLSFSSRELEDKSEILARRVSKRNMCLQKS